MKPGKPEFLALKGKFAAFLLILIMLAGHSAYAAEKSGQDADGEEQTGFSAGGYFKSFFTVLQPAAVNGLSEDQPAEGISSNNFRIKLGWKPDKTFSMDAAYELIPQIQVAIPAGFLPLPQVNPLVYRAYDLGGSLYPQSGKPAAGFQLAQNLDRLFVTYSPAFGDIMIGRQPVAFGSAHVINPTDVLAPFTFQTLDKEERTGVDALRLRIPAGSLGEFDAGYVLGQQGRLDRSALFLKQRTNLWGTDITGLVMDFRQNLLLGLNFNRSIGGASTWLEAAYVQAGTFGELKPSENYLRLSAGADYNLTESLYGLVEYHYNGAGRAEPSDYPESFQQTAYTEGSVYLLGRHYFIPGITWQISPLLLFNGEVLWNLSDMSFFIAPSWDYSFANDVTLEAGAYIPAGRNSEYFSSLPSEPAIHSEFGLYPAILFASIKVYF